MPFPVKQRTLRFDAQFRNSENLETEGMFFIFVERIFESVNGPSVPRFPASSK